MSKYLHIIFNSAKLFPRKRESSDFIVDFSVKEHNRYKTISRNNLPRFAKPITVNHISNMLHVLMNERPIPSFRTVQYKRVDKYYDMANNSLLKFTTLNRVKIDDKHYAYDVINPLDDIEIDATEKIQIRKSVHDSFSKSDNGIYWERLRRYLEPNEFNEMIRLMNIITNYDVLTETYSKVREIIQSKNSQVIMDLEALRNRATKNFINYLIDVKFSEPEIPFNDLTWNEIKSLFKIEKLNAGTNNNLISYELFEPTEDGTTKNFINILTPILGDSPLNFSVEHIKSVLSAYTSKNINELINYLIKIGRTAIATNLTNPNATGTALNMLEVFPLHVFRAVDDVIILSGEIYIPVDDDDIEKLRRSSGCATILDGGVVTIKGICYNDEFSDEEFTKVSEISTQLI